MEGKHGLQHLFNDNKTTQMKPKDFIEFVIYLKDHKAGIITNDNAEISEKIDGSSQFFGYDEGGFFWEKFGQRMKIRRESDFDDNPWLSSYRDLFVQAKNSKSFENFCEDLMADEGYEEVKVQVEVVLNAASKSEDDELTQIVLVPYKRSKMGPNGMGFIIQVLGDVHNVPNESERAKEAATALALEGMMIATPDTFTHDDINLQAEIKDFYNALKTVGVNFGQAKELLSSRKKNDKKAKDALIKVIQDYQKDFQTKIASYFPNGKYGDYYEGLVIKLGDEWMIKITSDSFKEFMAIHNAK